MLFCRHCEGEEAKKKRKEEKKDNHDVQRIRMYVGGVLWGEENAQGWRTPAPARVHPI